MISTAHDILEKNILPYWMALRDPVNGGFYGQVLGDETVVRDAPRGSILYARILWAFSAAYRVLHKLEYLQAADEAGRFIERHMLAPEDGAAYWSVTADGRALDSDRKRVVQAYMLYAYSEYFRATDNPQALQKALSFYRLLQTGGEQDDEDTRLHLVEAYTNLYHVWPEPELKTAIRTLLIAFGTLPHTRFNAGHCIECAWLLDEAATAIGEPFDDLVRSFAEEAGLGFNADGTLDDREWWKQAEAVVGYSRLYRRFADEQAHERAQRTFRFIQERYIDREHGEWYGKLLPDGSPDLTYDKAGFWKCPYHNTRMCLLV